MKSVPQILKNTTTEVSKAILVVIFITYKKGNIFIRFTATKRL